MTTKERVLDGLSLVFSVGIVLVTAIWLTQSGAFNVSLTGNDNITWYLIRAAGITAYTLLTVSMVWGLAVSSRVVKDWSPGALSMLLHSTVSWLALGFSAFHMLLLLVDKFFSYQITDVLIPFVGPYRPLAVGLGTLAFWILVFVTPSFALKKRLFSQRAWKLLHYTSYAAFLMVTAHGIAAGTDSGHIGFRLLIVSSLLVTGGLLAHRVRSRTQATPAAPIARRTTSRSRVPTTGGQ